MRPMRTLLSLLLLLGLLLLLPLVRAEEFRMIERPPPETLAAPAWKIGIDLTAERKKPLFLYFTANW